MTRHCFLVSGDVIIDPTSYEQAIKGEFSYQIFKTFSTREYVDHFMEYYSRLNDNLNIAPWFEYSMEEEECYCQYLIETQIPVNNFSYKEFLSKYAVMRCQEKFHLKKRQNCAKKSNTAKKTRLTRTIRKTKTTKTRVIHSPKVVI